MRTRPSFGSKALTLAALVLTVPCFGSFAGEAFIDFESGRWAMANAEVVEHMGRTCLMGMAYLDGVEFDNGVIEVDISVDGSRSYAGINLRIQSAASYESFYIRPHRAGLYPDALQYTPVFNGIACWQLYHGEGCTAGVQLAEDEWVHIRLEVLGTQAKVYVGGEAEPALVINELKHGESSGTIGLFGPMDGTAYFSNFRFSGDGDLDFAIPPPADMAPGVISDWQMSQVFKATEVDFEIHPKEQSLAHIEWQNVSIEPPGFVNVARYVGRSGREPDCILARAVILSDQAETKKYLLGYSDYLSLFLNGRIVFSANSAYQSRDPSFLGIMGFNDAVYLPLERGKNEVLLMVAEAFGGWGFMMQDGTAVFEYQGVEMVWETGREFRTPEAVVQDHRRNVLYVSNYDAYNPSNNLGKQAISKVSLEGEMQDPDWVTGLNNPTGMAIFQGRLFVVERAGVVEIDTDTGEIVERHLIAEPGFPNDIAIDRSGTIYVSDSRKGVIYRSADHGFEEWLVDDEIVDPNGLHIHENRLLVGSNGDNTLKSVDLSSGEISTVARPGLGIIDGISTDRDGNYVVSHWQGRIYRISQSGEILNLLDTTVPEINCADFEYVVDQDLILIPTFFDNRLRAYKIPR